MSTVDRDSAEVVRRHNGVYPGDEGLPPVVRIWRYRSKWDTDAYTLVYEGKPDPIPSEYVRDLQLWWSRT